MKKKLFYSVLLTFVTMVVLDFLLKQLNYPSDLRLYGSTAGIIVLLLCFLSLMKCIWRNKTGEKKENETNQPADISSNTNPNNGGVLRNS